MSIKRDMAAVSGCAAIFAPLSILAHEAGHYISGLSMGYPVAMEVASVSGGAVLGIDPNRDVALQAAAGPVVTLIIALFALAILRQQPLRRWAFAMAIVVPTRAMVGVVFLYYHVKARLSGEVFQGKPNFDEFNAATALGWSPVLLLSIQTALLILYYVYVIHRYPSGQRIWGSLAALCGGIAGISVWMIVVGPAALGLIGQ
jgi:hypothetical protein